MKTHNEIIGMLSTVAMILDGAVEGLCTLSDQTERANKENAESRVSRDEKLRQYLVQVFNHMEQRFVKQLDEYKDNLEAKLLGIANKRLAEENLASLKIKKSSSQKANKAPISRKAKKPKEGKTKKNANPWYGNGRQAERAKMMLELLQTWETVPDMASLFECSDHKVRTVLNRLRMEGKVVRRKDPDSGANSTRWQYKVRVPNSNGEIHYGYP